MNKIVIRTEYYKDDKLMVEHNGAVADPTDERIDQLFRLAKGSIVSDLNE